MIVDDEAGSKIRPGSATIVEGDLGTATVEIPVVLTEPRSVPVTVAWATASGSAVAGADFDATSGTLTFAPGQTQATIPISVRGDEVREPAEYFVLRFSNPVDASMRGWLDVGFGLVSDDD